jgi:hypothetical protein
MAKVRQKRYKIIPRTSDAQKEPFVKVNGKTFPIDIPVPLTENDKRVIKNYKEPMMIDKEFNIYQLMDELKVSKQEAVKIAQARGKNSAMRWVNKYDLIEV